MKNISKDCYVILKSGIIKGYWFSDNFYNEFKELVEKVNDVYDDYYYGVSCVFAASEKYKDETAIKNKLLDTLEELFKLNVEIKNGFDNKRYKKFTDIKDYVLNYGKED